MRELGAMFADAGIPVLGLDDAGIAWSPEEREIECFDTLEANALAKARYFFARGGGRTTVADDSGLEVRALAGAPGVHSHRWCGRSDLEGAALDRENNRTLLARLEGVTDRLARFVCVAALVRAPGEERVFRGIVAGSVLHGPRGDRGFGYDPLFAPEELGGTRTFGECTIGEKASLSHRARAFHQLIRQLLA